MAEITIEPFVESEHRGEVVGLWEGVFGYQAEHNRPGVVIEKKVAVGDGLFFVAVAEGVVVGTVMAGYDGHRGWIYAVAVSPGWQKRGVGSRLVGHAERELAARGCVKVNLQVMEGNEGVVGFYSGLGYAVERRVSMGKRIGGVEG